MTRQKRERSNIEAERAVLGCALIDESVLDQIGDLLPEQFYLEAHRKIFAAILALRAVGTSIDFLTVSGELEKRGQLPDVGGISAISALGEAVPVSTGARDYAALVMAEYRRRQVIEAADELSHAAREDSDESGLEERARRLQDLAVAPLVATSVVTLEQGVVELFDAKDAMTAEYGGRAIPTGWPSLDRLLNGGWTAGKRPYWLAAPTGVGKTAAAVQTALWAALKLQIWVLLFSLEMAREDVVSRAICCWGKIERTGFERWVDLDPDAQYRAIQTAEQVMRGRMLIDASGSPPKGTPAHRLRRIPPSYTLAEMRRTLKRELDQRPIGLIVLDYIQRVRVPGAKGIYDRVSAASNGLAELAQEFGIPCVGVAMIGRNHKLKGSGDLEQDAEAVIQLHRAVSDASKEELEDMSEERRRAAKMIITKNASGPTGVVPVSFFGEWGYWGEVSEESEPVTRLRKVDRPIDAPIYGTGHGQPIEYEEEP